MIRYALYDYLPQRYLKRASFEQIDLDRRILDFKNGRGYATRWAAREMARCLSLMDLHNTVIVCIPASCKRTNDIRYKRFTEELSQRLGAVNGFGHIIVNGHRQKVHISHVHELADGANECYHIDEDFFRGKSVMSAWQCFSQRHAISNIKIYQIMNATTVKLSVRQWASEDRPSNKLQTLGAEALTDSELLAILVGSGTQQRNAVEIGQDIMSRFDHSLSRLAKADFRAIKDIEGVGTYTACKIIAAIELGKRRQMEKALMAPDLCTATAIYNYMAPRMQDLQVEEAHVILMNQNFKLIKSLCISRGGITETAVDIRIIMKEAVLNNATILAFCHNHPSGNVHPSRYDDELTRSIKKACELMRIHFSDHVIVGDCQYYSYHEQGKL